MTRALLIEPQALFVPYFSDVLERIGLHVTVTRHAPKKMLAAVAPALVVLDVTHAASKPLGFIKRIRQTLPGAHVVVFAPCRDAMWSQLAQAMGADAVIGPVCDEASFLEAVRPQAIR